MYDVSEKDKYISDAAWILVLSVLDLEFEIDVDNREYYYDGEIQVKKGRRTPNNKEVEERFKDWIESIKAIRSTTGYIDEDRPLEIEEEILGQYIPMSSPGVIVLNLSTMKKYFKEIVEDMLLAGYSFSFSAFYNMAEICARKTVYHEYFHHYSDIQKLLFGFLYRKDIEEALAVAWSRLEVDEFCIKDLKLYSVTPVFDAYKRKLYNYYTPGYRDWKNFSNLSSFSEGVRHYMMPSVSNQLLMNGVNLGLLVLKELDWTYQTSEAIKLKLYLR